MSKDLRNVVVFGCKSKKYPIIEDKHMDVSEYHSDLDMKMMYKQKMVQLLIVIKLETMTEDLLLVILCSVKINLMV